MLIIVQNLNFGDSGVRSTKQYGWHLHLTENELFPKSHSDYKVVSPSGGYKPTKTRWEDIRNRRTFFETFAKSHGVLIPKDWGKISVREVQRAKGWGLLKKYEGSLLKALQASFPGSPLL